MSYLFSKYYPYLILTVNRISCVRVFSVDGMVVAVKDKEGEGIYPYLNILGHYSEQFC